MYRLLVLVFVIIFVASDAFAARRRSGRAQSGASEKYAAIVIDGKTGQVLYDHRATQPCYPASLTKMMTLYLTFRALEQGKLRLSDRLYVSHRAARQKPCKLGLCVGDEIAVRDAVCGMIVKSSNDGAVALAEHMGGTEDRFAQMMTQEARRLGMKNTCFANASGWHHAGNITTPRDMAILARALYYHYPSYYRYFSLKQFRFRGASYTNHNKLLGRVDGVNGIKTGFTNPAGFNLAASAVREGKHVITVVMGGGTNRWRDQRTTDLLNRGFELIERNKPQLRLASHFVGESSGPRRAANHQQKNIEQRVNGIFTSLENQGILARVQTVNHESCNSAEASPVPPRKSKSLKHVKKYSEKTTPRYNRHRKRKSHHTGGAMSPERLHRRVLGA